MPRFLCWTDPVLHDDLRRRIDDIRRARAAAAGHGAAPGAGAASAGAELAVGGTGSAAGTALWHVRRAGLVDVNAIARMIQHHRPFIDLDGDGEPDEVPNPEHAGPAARLVLSHGALEHGEVWFARHAGTDAADAIAAVAVWMPPDAEGLAADLYRVVARELDTPVVAAPEPAHAPLRSMVGATAEMLRLMQVAQAERVLIMLSDDGRYADAQRLALLAELLAPVVAEQTGAGRDVLAVTVDPRQVGDLLALGFVELGRTPLGAATLWLGALRGEDVRQAATATE